MQRDAAKTMALHEATNDYFEKVQDQVNAALSAVQATTTNLGGMFKEVTGLDPNPSQLEGLLMEAYGAGGRGDACSCPRQAWRTALSHRENQ